MDSKFDKRQIQGCKWLVMDIMVLRENREMAKFDSGRSYQSTGHRKDRKGNMNTDNIRYPLT